MAGSEDTADGSRVSVVLGGSRGIGFATSERLAREPGVVVLTSRSTADAEKAAASINGRATIVPMACDVTDTESSRGTVERVLDRFGQLDRLIANAAVNPYFARPEALTTEMWDNVFGVNLRGLFFAAQAAAKPMIKVGRGTVVFVSSVTARVPMSRGLPYTASKAGLDAVVLGLAHDWARYGLRVNGVAPGYISTDMSAGLEGHADLKKWAVNRTLMRRFGDPGEVADVICFLASDRSSYVTGQIYNVDGGISAK